MHCWWVKMGLADSYNIKHIHHTTYSSVSLKRNELCPHKDLYTNSYSSLCIITNMKTSQISISWWMNKQIVVTGPQKSTNYWYMQWHGWISKVLCQVKKPLTKGYTHCIIPIIWHSGQGKLFGQKSNPWLPVTGDGERINCKATQGNSWE